jgi:hypothetical protein
MWLGIKIDPNILHYDIAELLLKLALNTNQSIKQFYEAK